MADVQATTLRINLTNSYGDSKNINIPNPKSSLTLESIRSAMAESLASDVFLAGTTYYTAVKTARRIVRTETDII